LKDELETLEKRTQENTRNQRGPAKTPAREERAEPEESARTVPQPVAEKRSPPPAPTKAASAAAEAQQLYRQGAEQLAGGDLQEAIKLFSRCIQADKRFGQCYRALGITHAKAGNGPQAARYYRLYLRVHPGAPDAEQVRQLLNQYEASY